MHSRTRGEGLRAQTLHTPPARKMSSEERTLCNRSYGMLIRTYSARPRRHRGSPGHRSRHVLVATKDRMCVVCLGYTASPPVVVAGRQNYIWRLRRVVRLSVSSLSVRVAPPVRRESVFAAIVHAFAFPTFLSYILPARTRDARSATPHSSSSFLPRLPVARATEMVAHVRLRSAHSVVTDFALETQEL